MDRRNFIAAGAAFAATGGPAAAKVSLQELSRYFNGIRTLEAKFTQTNAGGGRSTGTLYMRRPGRARFEYDPPDESLVMAGGGQVAVFDGRSNTQSADLYPLKRTPLYIILERNVDLNRRNMVVGHRGDATTTTLVAQDPEAPQNGRVELLFQNRPLTLAGWTVIDGQGARTDVRLTQIRLGGQLSAGLFNIDLEQRSRGN